MNRKSFLFTLIILISLGAVGLSVALVSHQAQASTTSNDWVQVNANGFKDNSNNLPGNDNAVDAFEGEFNITTRNSSSGEVQQVSIITYTQYIPCLFKQLNSCPSYVDDFSDPASGWPIGESSNARLQYINGEYQILVKPINMIVFTYGDFGARDFRLAVDVRPAAHLDGASGLIFSKDDAGFYFYANSEDYFSLFQCEESSGVCSLLITWTKSAALKTGFQSNHLEVLRQGASIKLYGNGQLLTSINHTAYQGTELGMGVVAFVSNYDARFDNLTIQTTCLGAQTSSAQSANGLSIKKLGIMPEIWINQP